MRVAVVGAHGFVGQALVPFLVSQGHSVVALDRRPRHWAKGVEMRGLGDLAKPVPDWAQLLSDVDSVVYLAGLAHDVSGTHDQAIYLQVNARAPHEAARVARDSGVGRFVFFSSIKTLGDRPACGQRFLESDPWNPSGIYGTSKALAEQWLLSEHVDAANFLTILRPPLMVGPEPKGNLRMLLKALERGVPLPLASPRIGRRSYLGLRSCGEIANLLLASSGPPRIVHARNDEEPTVGELCRMLAAARGISEPRLLSVSPELLYIGASVLGRGSTYRKICEPMLVDDSASRSAVGWTPPVGLEAEFAI